MEYQEYIIQKKEIYNTLYHFIENENTSESDFQKLINYLDSKKIQENTDDFKLILHIINNISNYHYRYSTFISKIEGILSFYSEYIKSSYTNSELFNIFQNNKRILLFLITNKIIELDESITKLILKKDVNFKSCFVGYFYDNYGNKAKDYFKLKKTTSKNYSFYFLPEIKQFNDFNGCSSLKEIIIPPSVTRIGYNAFRCSSLEKIVIPSSVIFISSSAFSCCSSLTQVTFEIPSSLKRIEYDAFENCVSLLSVFIPSSSVIVDGNAFPPNTIVKRA